MLSNQKVTILIYKMIKASLWIFNLKNFEID